MNFKTLICAALIATLFFRCIPFCLAHPHVFIENSITILFDEKGLAGIRVKWIFDEFFSNMILTDYDRNKNHQLERTEITTIQSEAFNNLVEFDYFTFIKINGHSFQVKYIRDFSAALIGDRLIYEFLIPCHVSGDSAAKEIRISQYDPTYYSRIALDKAQPVLWEGEERFEAHYHIEVNKKEAYYYNQIHPVEVILLFKLKNE